MKKYLRQNLVSVILTAVMFAAVIITAYALLFPSSKTVLGCRFFIIATGSMGDSIKQGELIAVKKTDPAKLKPGDIITFISDDPAIQGQVNTHRVSRTEPAIYTKGDANPAEDPVPADKNKIIGRVFFHSAALGFIIRTLGKPIYMALFILLPVLYMAASDILSLKKLKHSPDKESSEHENEK